MNEYIWEVKPDDYYFMTHYFWTREQARKYRRKFPDYKMKISKVRLAKRYRDCLNKKED